MAGRGLSCSLDHGSHFYGALRAYEVNLDHGCQAHWDGAIREDSRIRGLVAWTLQGVFNESMDFAAMNFGGYSPTDSPSDPGEERGSTACFEAGGCGSWGEFWRMSVDTESQLVLAANTPAWTFQCWASFVIALVILMRGAWLIQIDLYPDQVKAIASPDPRNDQVRLEPRSAPVGSPRLKTLLSCWPTGLGE